MIARFALLLFTPYLANTAQIFVASQAGTERIVTLPNTNFLLRQYNYIDIALMQGVVGLAFVIRSISLKL